MLTNPFCSFLRNNNGSIAIIFAMSFVVILATSGGAIDYSRWTQGRSETQSAMDSAVLAAGRLLQLPNTTNDQAITAAQKYYDRNKSRLLSPNVVTFSVSSDRSEVTATSSTSAVPTPFLALLGLSSLPVEMTASAKLASGSNGNNVEISLMLDITGSMEGSKIQDLKVAAKDLIDIVVWSDQSQYTSRVALAPFSRYVNVGMDYFSTVTGQSATGINKTCVKERNTSQRYTDHQPNPGHYFDAYTGSYCPTTATILPLTNNTTMLHHQIDSLSTGGSTAGHLGTAWAWYLLSPQWKNVFPAESEPKGYELTKELNKVGLPKLYKIAVLMTDGAYNAKYSGDSSTTQARELCTNMKDKGITIYSVGFAIPVGSESDVTMQQCATSAEHYYNATDGDALKSSFRDIALKIMTLRLSK